MKKNVLLFCIGLCGFAFAQTNTWTGSGGTNSWSVKENWSLNTVPTSSNDVVIPTGFTVNAASAATMKSVKLQGNSTLNISANFTFTNASEFAAQTTVNWNSGNLQGGGTLVSKGNLYLATAANKFINDNIILENSGIITTTGTGSLYIQNGTVNNTASGIIDFQTAGSYFTYSGGANHNLINAGTIKRTTNDGNVIIYSKLINNNGTINVEKGKLTIDFSGITLNSGTYNVSSGAELNLESTINLSGTLTGTLNGAMNWNGTLVVPTSSIATFNFTGNALNWNSGNLNSGGTLKNQSKLNLNSTANKFINDGATLENSGTITTTGTGSLYIQNGTVNNTSSGVIDFQTGGSYFTYSGGANHNLINAGTIKRTTNEGDVIIYSKLINNNGTINVEKGKLALDFSGITLNSGTYNVSSGAELNLESTIYLSGTLAGTLNGAMNWNGTLVVPTSSIATFNFTGNALNWNAGNLNSGGTLKNQSKLNLSSTANKFINDGATLENSGTITTTGTGSLYIQNGTVNNISSGIIDFQTAGSYFTFSGGANHNLINAGTIKRTTNDGNVIIYSKLINNNGTINVEKGKLALDFSGTTLNSGTYNVSSAAELNLENTIQLSGTLAGNLSGAMNWNGTLSVPETSTTVLNFTGNPLNWNSGNLNGGGTLKNQSKLNLNSTANKFINDGATLENSGTITTTGTGSLYIQNGTVNNTSSGMIDFQIDGSNFTYSGGTLHEFVNNGIFRKSVGNGIAHIQVNTTNNGKIQVLSGTLQTSGSPGFVNEETGVISGIGSFGISNSNFINKGIFAPGNSPGKLTVLGNFTSESTSVLDIEINGLTQSTQYDFLDVQGNGIFKGKVNISLGIPVNLNNEFVVSTTSGNITNCSLNPVTETLFEGYVYKFSVSCSNDNKNVILKLTDKYLSANEADVSEKDILIYPNPVQEQISIKNGTGLKIIRISIFDFSGKLMKSVQSKAVNNDEMLNLSELNTGNYLMKIDLENGRNIQKKIIKK